MAAEIITAFAVDARGLSSEKGSLSMAVDLGNLAPDMEGLGKEHL